MIKVIKNIAVLGENSSGVKQFNLVSIDSGIFWDIRKWYVDANGEAKMSKHGITLNDEQMQLLKDAVNGIDFGSR